MLSPIHPVSGSFWPLAALYTALIILLYLVFGLRDSGTPWPGSPEFASQGVLAVIGALALVSGLLARHKASRVDETTSSPESRVCERGQAPDSAVMVPLTWTSAVASTSVVFGAIFGFLAVLVGTGAVISECLRGTAARRRGASGMGLPSIGLPIAFVLLVAQCWLVADLAGVIVARDKAVARKGECFALMRSTLATVLPDPEQGEVFPTLEEWKRQVSPRAGTPSQGAADCVPVYNARVSGVHPIELANPDALIVLSEGIEGGQPGGAPGALADEPPHFGGDHYGFADGSVRWLPRKKNPDGTWAKEPDADWVIWEPVLKESEGEQEAPQADKAR